MEYRVHAAQDKSTSKRMTLGLRLRLRHLPLGQILPRHPAPRHLIIVRRLTQKVTRTTTSSYDTMSPQSFKMDPHQIPINLPEGLDKEQVLSFRPFNVRFIDPISCVPIPSLSLSTTYTELVPDPVQLAGPPI